MAPGAPPGLQRFLEGCPVRLADLRPAWTDSPHDNRSGLAGKPMGSAASCRWTRTGETFETLTLRPSVDAREIHHAHFTLTDGTLYVE